MEHSSLENIRVCPGTLAEGFGTYSPSAIRNLFDGHQVSHILPYGPLSQSDEDAQAFRQNRERLSISGVQEKVSLLLEKNQLRLTKAGEQGMYILKPIPRDLDKAGQVPANEHLTMQAAKQVYGIEVAQNALMFFKNGEPAYLTRRFDVRADGTKRAVEDFASLAGKTEESGGRNFKYDYSYEEVGLLIRKLLPAWQLEIEKFFRLVVFNYLFSNGDAHLKNFAVISTEEGDHILSPAYDLLNTRLHVADTPMALRLFREGNKQGYPTYKEFVELGARLGIRQKRIVKLLAPFCDRQEAVYDMIGRSFLNSSAKNGYEIHYNTRLKYLRR